MNADQIGDVLEDIGIALTLKELWDLKKTLPITCEHFQFELSFGEAGVEHVHCGG